MRNFTDAQNALITATNSENSAQEESDRALESIQKKITALSAEYQKFVLGKGGLEDFIKQLLDFATAIMKIINSLGGLKTVASALGTVIAVALVKNLTAFDKKIEIARKSTNGFKAVLNNTATALQNTQFAIGEVLAVLGLMITIVNAVSAKIEENLRLLEEELEKNQETVQQAKENIKILQDENASRDELANAISSVIEGYDTEGKSIEELNKKRQEAIDLLKEEQNEADRATVDQGYSQYIQDKKRLEGKGLLTFQTKNVELEARVLGLSLEEYRDALTQIQEANVKAGYDTDIVINKIAELTEIIEGATNRTKMYEEAMKRLDLYYIESTGAIKEFGDLTQSELAEVGEKVLDYYEAQDYYHNTIPYFIEQNEKLTNTIQEQEKEVLTQEEYLSKLATQLGLTSDELSNYINNLDDDALEEFSKAISDSDLNTGFHLIQQYLNTLEEASKLQEDFAESIKNSTQVLKDAESAYSIVDKALSEFNSMGGVSADTIQNLASLGDDWIQVLYDSIEAGEISQDTLDKLSESHRNLAIAELQAQAGEDMMKIAIGEVNTLSPIAQTAIENLKTKVEEEAESATEASKSNMLNALAMQAYEEAAGRGGNVQGAIDQITAVEEKYQELINNMSSWTLGGGTTDKKGSKGSSSKDTYLEAFKKEKEALKHQLEMDYISEKEYYDSLSELVERYFGVATGLHEKYLDTYQENEEEIYKGLKSIYDKVKDYLAEAVEKSYEDAIKVVEKEEEKVLGTIQKQIDDLKDQKDEYLKSVEKEINALKDQKDERLKSVKKEIDAIKDQKEAVEDYWNAEIDKIKQANKELEQQNQLLELQKKLAEAKSQKVMVMGEEGTFGLAENEKSVSSAELNLRKYEDELSYEQQLADMEAMRDAQLENLQGRIDDLQNYYDYLSEYYQSQIDALEDYYDTTKEAYENQINALEDYYDRTKEIYQSQIDALQEQLDAFKAGQEEYDNIQKAKLASQVMAMDAEAENWNKELANLRNYINQYNSMLTQLGTAGKYVDYSYSPEDGVVPVPTPIGGGVPRHAKGIASVANNEIALVGDSPNRELVLGANVNKLGTLMALSKGSGVVNAESTDTLAGVLNSLTSPTASGSKSNVTQTFSFGNISLPNVTDANSFVKELSDKFNNYAIQFSSIRE